MTQNLIPLAHPADTTVTMTSHELVEFINNHRKEQAEGSGYAFPSKGFAKLEHKNFLAKVPEVLGAQTSAKFLADLPDSYGRLQPAYRFPKREATLMAMSYSYALQAAVYDHMTALEAKAAQPQPQVALPHDYITALEHLLESKKAEQLAIAQRDEAIRTKAQIGDRKTATAMATASAATKKANKLEIELDRSRQYATVKRMAHNNSAALEALWRWGDGAGGGVLDMIAKELGLHSPASAYPSPASTSKKQIIGNALRTKVFERDAYRCVHCATHLSLTVDHIKPESKGGTLDFDNLQTLCRPCNSRKGVK